ncbi:Protein kinase, putative [Hondaea fermentalgiana]|uniref:non-specific serine/threonine protein kinase n=1 Tax=Hondaea fermentalgiana TaxID=2315210 RepID=A0A2R5GGG1_9STRA|nr:Protein kinase, putative [Hondaea fermentalgiana]|eukprot:GBG29992.1 Protein kinase, putative [Hondaea fermentalgiana]
MSERGSSSASGPRRGAEEATERTQVQRASEARSSAVGKDASEPPCNEVLTVNEQDSQEGAEVVAKEVDVKEAETDVQVLEEEQEGEEEVFWCCGLSLAGQFGVRLNQRALTEGVIIKRLAEESKPPSQELDVLQNEVIRKSPFIVDLVCVVHVESCKHLVLENCVFGDLTHVWKARGLLTISQTMRLAAEVSLGLEALHSQGYIHGDIKPENICFDVSGHAKIIDFGLSQVVQVATRAATRSKPWAVVRGSGTLNYASPEVLSREAHRFECDWWALGVLLFECISGLTPWTAPVDDLQAICDEICTQDVFFQDVFDSIPEIVNLIRGLLQRNPAQRFGCSGLCGAFKAHPAWALAATADAGIVSKVWSWSLVQRRELPILSEALTVSLQKNFSYTTLP